MGEPAPKISYSDTLAAGLLAETEAQNSDCIPLVRAVVEVVQKHRMSEGLDAGFVASAEAFLAFEALAKTAKASAEAIRRTLTSTVHDCGCPGFYTAHHHITPKDAARVVRVLDQTELEARHPGLMIQPPQPPVPPKQPDLDTIKKRLKAGDAVAGCELSNGGMGSIVFSKAGGKV